MNNMDRLLQALESKEMNACLEVRKYAHHVLLDAANYVNLSNAFTMMFLLGLASER